MAVKVFTGGEKLEAKLRELAAQVTKAGTLNVGFLEGATYPDGVAIANIAAVQEFGATIEMPEREQTVYRSVNAQGNAFLKNGRFVKRGRANFSSTHHVAAYTITIPPRPFFRRMVSLGRKHWGGDVALALKLKNYDAPKALKLVGEQMVGELQQSITDQVYKPLANSTVAKKGFDTTLIDKGTMLRAVDSEIEE